MTVDDLVALVEEILGGADMTMVREGDVALVDGLSDQGYLTLVAFVSGDRPTAGRDPAPVAPVRARRLTPVTDEELAFMDDEDARAEADPFEVEHVPGVEISKGVTLL